MPREKSETPSYLRHSSGKARACWTDYLGIRRETLLPGKYGSQESKTAYSRLVLELATAPNIHLARQGGLTVAELLVLFLKHAETYYGGHERSRGEYRNYIDALRPVRELYASTPAEEFGPLKLKAVREQMIRSGLSRRVINHRVARIKSAFRWAVGDELIPSSVYEALRAVPGLRAGKTVAKDYAEVEPVEWVEVQKVLPFLSCHVRAIVELLWWTGARPSEIVQFRLADLERHDGYWLYKPTKHKTAHHGHQRVIVLGREAVRVLTEFLAGRSLDPTQFVFSPMQSMEEWAAERSRQRETPLWPSHADRNSTKRATKRKRAPREIYDAAVVNRAVARACDRAGIPRWNIYRLRHAAGTRFRREHGLEVAQALLGHRRASMTEVYAAVNLPAAIESAKRSG